MNAAHPRLAVDPLAARIASLQSLQDQRIALVAKRKRQLDAIVERHQRELDNLRARQGADRD